MSFAPKLQVSILALAIGQLATLAPAHAAEDEADAALPAAPASGGDEAGGGDDSGLTAIVVTATKRETDLQETPISLSVLDDEEIKRRHVQSLLDLADGGVPSLRVATYESRQSALTIGIRGIVPGDANQPAREQGVGVYLDGVYLGRQHGLNAALFDVERIEVLKGPQGTLFGRNTEGGAVSIITKAPSGEFGGRVTAGAGNFGSYTGGIHVDLPAFADVSIKLDGVIDHQDATVKNPLPGETGWNFHHRYGGRVAARWEPMDNFTADFAFDIARDENSPFYSQLINFNPLGYPVATVAEIAANGNRLPAGKIAPLPPIVTVTDERMKVADIGVPQQPSVDKTKGFMANLAWDPSDTVQLRSITAWRTVSADQWDNSGGAHRTPTFLPNGNFSRYSLSFLNQRQFSQEFQVVGSFPQVDYVLGLYYFNERAEEVASTPNTNRWNATGTGYTINDPAPWNPANWNVSRATVAFAKSYAAYGQATWTPAGLDTLHITAGGRYTHDDKSGNLYRLNNAATDLPFEYEGGRFDPLAIVAWEASPAVNLYAKYSTGYRSGGASSRSPTFRSFGPETVTSYEIGAKTEPLDGVRFNVAGYLMNREDAQFDFDFYIPQPNGTIRHTLETVNAPDTVKIKGIEADLTVSPAPGLRFGLAYAYTDWSVPASPNPLVPGSAPQPIFIVFTPPHAVSGAVDYELFLSGSSEMALKFHLDANYSDRHYSFDNEDVKVDDSFLVNARLTLADIPMSAAGQTLSISLWSRNLLNEAHIYRRSNANRVPIDGNIATVVGDYANFNTPRTFGAEATVSF